jgi:lysophosphatidic acid acyltransferase / lysophosphatidylinositol acyltransferase
MVSLAQWWSASDFDIYIKDEDLKHIGHEHAIVVLNHKYDIDWLLGWILCQRGNLFAGAKVVSKSTLKYIPILGWSFWFAEYIFLKRVWETDKNLLVKDLNNIFDYPKGLHYCVCITCKFI